MIINNLVEYDKGYCLTNESIVFTIDKDFLLSGIELTGPCIAKESCIIDNPRLLVKLFDITETELTSTTTTIRNFNDLRFHRVSLLKSVSLRKKTPYKIAVYSRQNKFNLQGWWWNKPGRRVVHPSIQGDEAVCSVYEHSSDYNYHGFSVITRIF